MGRRARANRRNPIAILAVLLALVAALAVSALGLALSQEAEARVATPAEKLAEIRVRPAGSMDGYSREKFPHWSDAQTYGWTLPAGTPDPGSCDARDAALIRDGRDEVVGAGCSVERGRWFDPYTGGTYYQPGDIDIDHFVPLANAWRSGAASWDAAKKERFANVPLELLSVEDNANASKGDKGPEAWKPPRTAYHCTYSKKWINIKHYWSLSVTSAEKSALKQMLRNLPLGAAEREMRSVFSSTAGGVMTVEVGAVTGELELATQVEDGRLSAWVRYAGAGEWYTAEGGPAPLGKPAGLEPGDLHRRLVEHLRRPGPVEAGNETAVSLAGFSPDSA